MSKETITALPMSGRGSVDLQLEDGSVIKTGVEPKTAFLASVIHRGLVRQIGHVIEKTPQFSAADMGGTDPEKSLLHYEKMWHLYQDAGLNVVRWLRRTDRNTVIMPDLTADGSALYGKSAQLMLNEADKHPLDNRQPHNLDPVFLTLTNEANFPNIVAGARKQMQNANNAGIVLPRDNDAFELVIHPENPESTWELLTLDLAHSAEGMPNNTTLERTNRRVTAAFLTDLLQIKAGLEGNDPALILQQRTENLNTVMALL